MKMNVVYQNCRNNFRCNYRPMMMFFHLLQMSLLISLMLILFQSLMFCHATDTSGHEHANTSMKCSGIEWRALLEIKAEFVDEYGLLSSWRTDARDCFRWRGIRCDNGTGGVIGLDLRGTVSHIRWIAYDYIPGPDYEWKGLRGKISSSITMLRNLEYLDLSSNHFHSHTFPNFISSLSKLKYLNLSHSHLEGVVSTHLANLSGLEVLDLNGSSLGSTGFNDLSMNLGILLPNLGSLRYLNLNSVNLSTTSNNWIQTLSGLPLLEELHMSNCSLPDHRHPRLPFGMNYSSRHLNVVDLSFNSLPSSSVYPWLFNLSHTLTYIDLSNNNLQGSIPDEFGNLIHLTHLRIIDSLLVGEIPRCFGNLSYLEELNLGVNELRGPVSDLMEDLSTGSSDTLKDLVLSYNQLSGTLTNLTGFSSLKNLVVRFNNLEKILLLEGVIVPSILVINLSTNQLTGSIPDFGFHFPSLKELLLQNNKLNGSLPESIRYLSKLESLHVSLNHLEGVVSELHLSNFTGLRQLGLAFCSNLELEISSGWIPPFQLDIMYLSYVKQGPGFPNWLQTQHNFSALGMSHSGIVDTIPSWFWDLSPRLQYLNLSGNQMYGQLPDISSRFSMRPLIDLSSNNFTGPLPLLPPNVTYLDLSRNKFEGPTNVLCDTTGQLSYLDLSDNLLSGSIPDCSSRPFASINVLVLSNNYFSGSIPRSLGNSMTGVEALILQNNNFTGEIPEALSNCKELLICDLSGNKFFGNIPAWIGVEWSSLIILNLGYNSLSGAIPSSFCRLGNIKILDLSRNQISRTIPKCFNNLTQMTQRSNLTRTINADPNLKVATAPVYHDSALLMWKGVKSMFRSTLGLVRFIDLSSNNLVGEIPFEMTELEGLVGLNLSRNNLTGYIPSHIGHLQSLDFLDLSRNMLRGEIPVSLSNLSLLGFLDLSYNNLSGKIPTGDNNKLQTFESSTYIGNPGLCGSPLQSNCTSGNMPGDPETSNQHDGDQMMTIEFYGSVAFGYIVGFWGVCGSLLIKRSWRETYFKFLSSVYDWFYVTVALKKAKIWRHFHK